MRGGLKVTRGSVSNSLSSRTCQGIKLWCVLGSSNRGSEPPVRFDYVLRQTNDGWRIVNVLADGVSDLALKRVEYRAILQRDGFQALIDMLKDKIVQTEQD